MNTIIVGKRYASKTTGFLVEVDRIRPDGQISYGWVDIEGEADFEVRNTLNRTTFLDVFEEA